MARSVMSRRGLLPWVVALAALSATVWPGGGADAARGAGSPPGALPPAPASALASAPAADPQRAATSAARLLGRPVEVDEQGNANTTVYAQPDGTMRAVITAEATRVRKDGRWVSIDPTLARTEDGGVAPVAVTRPLRLSAGGARQPVVSLGSGAQRLDLFWPAQLPVPRLDGATATYSEVRPGVDLRVTASDAGFAEVLVVRERAAALGLLADPPTLQIASPGLTVRQEPDGSLRALDAASGAAVFQAPPATMWDARRDPATMAGPVRPVRTSLSGGVITLGLDAAFVADPQTVFPVEVDPSFTASKLNWTEVLSQDTSGGNVSFWNGQNLSDPNNHGLAMTGFFPTGNTGIARAFFQMNTSSMNSKHILGATFRITEGWANNCTPEEVQLWETGGISSSTTFNHQPGWNKKLSAQTTAHGWSSNCPAAPVAFDATAAVRDAHDNNWPNLTLGLRALDEADQNGWKRFKTDATLQVDYNTVPTVGTRSTSPTTACVAGSDTAPNDNDPLLNTATPVLMAIAGDADASDNNLKGSFVWQSWNGSAWVASGSAVDPIGRTPGTTTSITTPALATGTYRWQVQITQTVMRPYTGTDASAWSSWCEFQVDVTPPEEPGVSSPQYPQGCAPCGGVGVTATFTLTPGAPDVSTFWYGFSDPPATQLTPATVGAAASFDWTPTSAGPTTLYVQSQDQAGNRSAEESYQFTVDGPAPVLAQWRLDETAGAVLADGTGHGHDATLNGGTLGAPSRIVGTTALALNGTAGQYAATTGTVLDTSRSFSVAAWAKLTDTASYHAVVAQDGAHSSGFQLQYDPTCTCWELVLPGSDGTNPTTTLVRAPTGVVTGVWTHLTGSYDSGTATASLYVNGALAGTTTGVAPQWNATGPLDIGRSKWNDAYGSTFAGSLGDVRVWQRVLYAADAAALVDPTTDPVGVYDFEEQGSSIAFDGSNYAHDLTLTGDATIPPSGAGHNNLGLLLMDGDGYAQSAGPSLHTDQSFTVAAWVRIDGTALPTVNKTAVSQIGTDTSAFFLGYRTDSGTPHWSFSMAATDSDQSTGWKDAQSTAAVTSADLGVWHHLVGVYNAATNTMSLYVDGALAATATRTVPGWDAGGALVVGAAQWSPAGGQSGVVDEWVGALDEVRVFAGAVADPGALR